MSRSNYDKPFYVDVGTSVVAIRCASNDDVLVSYDFTGYPFRLKLAKDMCERMNSEFEAALKREKAAIEADTLAVGGIVEAARRESHFADVSKMGGNAAAMREALETARRTLKLVYENAVEFIQPRLADEIIHTGSTIKAAVATPPRNCDRFKTLAEALLASGETTAEAPGLSGMGNAQLVRFCKWLFAFG